MKILITGITGQDGSYLAEKLLDLGHEVHGIIRRSSSFNTPRIDHIFDKLILHYGDLTDSLNIDDIISKVKPDRIYNLAAQSHVQISFFLPLYTVNTDGVGTLVILEAVRKHCPNCRIYNATTSELFGLVQETPQNEKTPFYPRSPYGVAKAYGHWITVNYRESYDLFAVSGILFNHESERRGLEFVTRKITHSVARIELGKQDKLYLGNLESKRDWGYTPDYVEAMWLMLQQDEPEDFVIGTGKTWSVRQFLELAFAVVGKNWQDYVEIDEKFVRPAEVDLLVANPTKAKKVLGWEPKTSFEDMVRIMVEADLEHEKN